MSMINKSSEFGPSLLSIGGTTNTTSKKVSSHSNKNVNLVNTRSNNEDSQFFAMSPKSQKLDSSNLDTSNIQPSSRKPPMVKIQNKNNNRMNSPNLFGNKRNSIPKINSLAQND
jgi:hypothetical protein